jgi:glutamate/tyrosine decarboxylase-like PLP-dependent enzyme
VTGVAGAERHDTIDRGLGLLGLGLLAIRDVEVDDAGRIREAVLEVVLAQVSGPTIVCAQAGKVNGGAVDPLGAIRDIVDEREAEDIWLHVDGTFGLWARAAPSRRRLLDRVERADSWATDAHKWLNVPYDCGVTICARSEAHTRAMRVRPSYLPAGDEEGLRNPMDFNPEFSRRARAVPVWAALRELGVAKLVDRCCRMAEKYAESLRDQVGVQVTHQDLNQVVVRFTCLAGGDDDDHTRRVVENTQQEGTCYPSATVWHGHAARRISVCNWRTDEEDDDMSARAILTAHREC